MPKDASAQRIEKDVRALSKSVGIRTYGSPGEQLAAQLVQDRMEALGLINVRQQPFAVTAFRNASASCHVRLNGRWRKVPCLPGSNTPATPTQGVQGDLALIDDVATLPQHGDLQDKIGLLLGGYGDTSKQFRALMDSGLAALILVDYRFPSNWPVDVGIPAVWFKYATLPIVCIPYTEAWRITAKGSPTAHITVQIERYQGRSQNVVGELPGRSDEIIVISAHHDSTPRCVSPDDNATGLAAMFELARIAGAQGPLGRTLRFVSFGAEEVLSEGARQYVMRLRRNRQAHRIRLVLNNDSIGSRLGRTTLWVWGPQDMAQWAKRRLKRATVPVALTQELCPFSDHFPFNAIGVPSFWFHRTNTASGRFYHHSRHDTMSIVSPENMARLVTLEADLLVRLANASALPWKGLLSEEQTRQLSQAARDMLGFR